MECRGVPKLLCLYVATHVRGSRIRSQLLEVLRRLSSGEGVRYKDIKRLGVRYHVDKMRRLGLLELVFINGSGYLVISPSLIARCIEVAISFGEESCDEAYDRFIQRPVLVG